MPNRYSVFSGFGEEEPSGIRYDSFDDNNLTPINDAGRRVAKFAYGMDFETFINECQHTLLQSEETAFNQTTFSTWLFFNSDVPVNDCILLGRYLDLAPIWSIRTINGHIAFETGDGISSSHSILGPEVLQGDHFVAVTYDDATGEKVLYYDGAVVATGVSEIYMPTDQTGVSYSSPLQPFNGWQDVAIWTELIVSTTDLDTIYDGGVGHGIIWYFDITSPGSLKCIYKNKVATIYRPWIQSTIRRNKVRTLEITK